MITLWFLGLALAHPLSPGAWTVTLEGDGEVSSALRVPVLAPRGERLRPELPDGCVLSEGPRAQERDARWVRTERWRCDPVPTEVGMGGMGERNLVAQVQGDGWTRTTVLHAGRRRLSLVAPAGPLRSGMEHLVGGADHVALVVGLAILLGWGRTLLVAVTAFTAGHALTLWLAAVGGLTLPSAWVELGIAATLVWLGVELAHGREHAWPVRHPAIVPAVVGLVHGLGFAGVFAASGLTVDLWVLLGFNLGLELAQLAVVGVVCAVAAVAGRVREGWAPLVGWGVGVYGALLVWTRLGDLLSG